MIKIHKGQDLEQVMTFSTLDISNVKNVYILVFDSSCNKIKQMAVNIEKGFNNKDITQVSLDTIKIRMQRRETQVLELGVYSFIVRVAVEDSGFEYSEKRDSGLVAGFEVVATDEPTDSGIELTLLSTQALIDTLADIKARIEVIETNLNI